MTQSATLRVLTSLSILPLALPGCTLFAREPLIVTTPDACSSLVPVAWKDGVPGAPLPANTTTVGDWIAFGDAQTAQLDKANGRTSDTLDIISRCEARDKAALERVKK